MNRRSLVWDSATFWTDVRNVKTTKAEKAKSERFAGYNDFRIIKRHLEL